MTDAIQMFLLWLALVIGFSVEALIVCALLLIGAGALLTWLDTIEAKRQVRAMEQEAAKRAREDAEDVDEIRARLKVGYRAREDDRWSRNAGRAVDRVIHESQVPPGAA